MWFIIRLISCCVKQTLVYGKKKFAARKKSARRQIHLLTPFIEMTHTGIEPVLPP